MPRKRAEVNVAIPRNLLQAFRRVAKRVWPREAYAILLGTHDAGQYIIGDIHFPLGWQDDAREDGSQISAAWWDEAARIAEVQDVSVLGDIHSHPHEKPRVETDCALSQQDQARFDEDWLQGIMTVTKCPSGSFRTRHHFWIPGPRVTTTILR